MKEVNQLSLFYYVKPFMISHVYFFKIGPNFVGLPTFNFKIYKRILRNTSLLGKILMDFVISNVKLHNRYCHSGLTPGL